VAHTCNPGYSGCRDLEDQCFKPVQVNREILSRKYATQKRAGGMAYVLERLPNKHMAVISTPLTAPQKKKKKKKSLLFEMASHALEFRILLHLSPSAKMTGVKGTFLLVEGHEGCF
jgi:hypothetical protein